MEIHVGMDDLHTHTKEYLEYIEAELEKEEKERCEIIVKNQEEAPIMKAEKLDLPAKLPKDKLYLEIDLPELVAESCKEMAQCWEDIKAGKQRNDWDSLWCELNSNINKYELSSAISEEVAWYLREKYLGMKKENNT